MEEPATVFYPVQISSPEEETPGGSNTLEDDVSIAPFISQEEGFEEKSLISKSQKIWNNCLDGAAFAGSILHANQAFVKLILFWAICLGLWMWCFVSNLSSM